MSRNITEVRLLAVPLENDYKHTLYFNSLSEQTSYFLSKTVKSGNDFSYQRKDKIIRYPADYDELLGCNYVMYKNEAYSNKWYYAFITKLEYVNDGRTNIYIETDVIQTWLFDYYVRASFIEREHVDDDTVGLHTYPEGLELGEYIINDVTSDTKLLPANAVVMGSTIEPTEMNVDVGGRYNGIYSGVKYYAYSLEGTEEVADAGINVVGEIIQRITDKKGDGAISSLFLAPEFLIEGFEHGGPIENSEYAQTYEFSVDKKYGLDGHNVRNNKLKTYPYCYLLVSNGNGGCAEYRYEFFNTEKCAFTVRGALTPGCSIRLIPGEYKNSISPESEGLNLGKYPQCNWATDQYTNWLTQNGVNVATGIAMGGALMMSAVNPVLAGTLASMTLVEGAVALSGFTQVASSLNEVKKASMIPPNTQGNINCGDVVTAGNDNTFHYYNMSIRKEYAEIIDGFFDMFGYKVGKVKVPNRGHRENWWYTKTIDVSIDGDIPSEDMSKIKACYNTGITFWRNPNIIGNYNGNGITNKII